MTMAIEPNVINDYLDRLDRAAQVLAPDRRIELLSEIREHIEDARVAEGGDGEAATRSVLERLGAPEEIVAAAGEGSQPWRGSMPFGYGGSPPRPRRSLALEIWAVVMLTVGSIVLPVIGWLVGVALMWSSDRWRLREKLLATLVVPGGLGAVGLALTVGTSVSSCFQATTVTQVGRAQQLPTSTGTCEQGSSWTDALVPAGWVIAALAALIVPLMLIRLARLRAERENDVSLPQARAVG
jgi:hypothetical protein